MKYTTILFLASLGLFVWLAGCASGGASPQPPAEYLDGALNWMQAHAVSSKQVDWSALRRDALALAPNTKTTGETYPAIQLAISRLKDSGAFLRLPDQATFDAGLLAAYPDGVVRQLKPGGPAEKAGIRLGDIIVTLNGAPLRPTDGNPATFYLDMGSQQQLDLTLRRDGEPEPIKVSLTQAPAAFADEGKPIIQRMGSGSTRVGYIELPHDSGGNAGPYPGAVHQFVREMEQAPVCGWIVDLRRNSGGNLWLYLAAVGPLLGEGKLGGFAYADGHTEPWTYEKGKILWNNVERDESEVTGGVYASKYKSPFVVLLVSNYTAAAGELVGVAFQGRPNVRVIGEATAGIATLSDHTPLSDGAHLFVSGAYGMDADGKVYDKPIQPDEIIETEWAHFGTVEDAVLTAGYVWLASQPACS